ncbi:hypothetical protein NPIL_163971 [Nephila pilipes]|uniref:Uncharacterized protein n=1 Tax=Nephila pilipes TaxID=299642 RepID=A0A8X6NN17_NEPPI|nr:hypothetical protein NPIL_163971 [Nephila pilipes]
MLVFVSTHQPIEASPTMDSNINSVVIPPANKFEDRMTHKAIYLVLLPVDHPSRLDLSGWGRHKATRDYDEIRHHTDN